MNAFLETVKKTEVPFGAGCLWWLGQMGLLVKLGETLLCVDYFASPLTERRLPPPLPAEETEGVDVFLGLYLIFDVHNSVGNAKNKVLCFSIAAGV